MGALILRQEQLRLLSHLGGYSSVSEVRSILAVLTSRRLSWSVSGSGAGDSSSSSWVGCREQSIVSSVMQLEVKRREGRFTFQYILFMDGAWIRFEYK